jgi:hypothetical protein
MVITSYIPAEKFSRAVEHPCQFWIGTRPFRLSVFGRRQQIGFTITSVLGIWTWLIRPAVRGEPLDSFYEDRSGASE